MRKKSEASSKRTQLIETAIELFAKDGFHATGIDTIAERSGVTKKTLYTHFRSKEELILATLHHYADRFRNEFMRQVDRQARTPKTRLLAIFDVAEKWFKKENFYGCMFINATGEYSKNDASIRHICIEYKRLMNGYIQELCQKFMAREPNKLAEEIALLLEGAIVTAQVSQQPTAAKIAKRVAAILIDKRSC
ncbi:MAG: TetR family transcriptional regulator [Nitrospirales bacterium]|nr:TetR family transcriptional regulator [Nitrospirales bacterium]